MPPTSEQCTAKAKVWEDNDRIGYAIWYPQMGGYVGAAIALFDKKWKSYSTGAAEGGCIDVYVWHDGEFPFSDGENPCLLHHCNPEQFIEFGKTLTEINQGEKVDIDG